MKNAIFALIVISMLASCRSSKKVAAQLPAAPMIEGYVPDSTEQATLNRIAAYNTEAERFSKRIAPKKMVKFIGVSVFGIYCILAWRYDIE